MAGVGKMRSERWVTLEGGLENTKMSNLSDGTYLTGADKMRSERWVTFEGGLENTKMSNLSDGTYLTAVRTAKEIQKSATQLPIQPRIDHIFLLSKKRVI